MSTKLMWRVCLGLIFIVLSGGCSAFSSNVAGNSPAAGTTTQPVFSLKVGDNDLTGSAGRQLGDAYKQEIALGELLKNSGLVTFNRDETALLTVNKVSLGQDMAWEIQLNGKVVTDWSTIVKQEDSIAIAAKSAAQNTPFEPVILTVNGGSGQPELTQTYVLPFTENLSVRGLLKSSGIVELAENNKTILTVKEYKPLTNEEWKLKLNDKSLLDNGIDMKLRMQDKLEVLLVLR